MQTASGLLLPNSVGHEIALPRVEFPRLLRGLGDALDRMMPLGGMLGPLATGSRVVATNWWEAGGATGCVAAYRAKGAASLAASYINLANPGTYNAGLGGGSLGWDAATGWDFPGATWLTTGISVNGGNATVVVRFSNAASNGAGARLCGTSLVNNGNPRLILVTSVESAGWKHAYANGNGATLLEPGLSAGVMAVAGNRAYLNGVDEGITLTAWSGTNTNGLFIGAQNNNGVPLLAIIAKIQSVAIYSVTLTAPQVAAVTAAMNAL